MAAAVAFPIHAGFEAAAWVHLPHIVLGVEVVAGTIVVARLYQQMELGVLRHGLPEVLAGMIGVLAGA